MHKGSVIGSANELQLKQYCSWQTSH